MTEQNDVASLIRRTNVLLSVLAKAQVRTILEEELNDAKKKRLYDLTDGIAPIKELSQKLGMATGSISTIWQHWEQAGLLVKEGAKYRRIFE